MAGLAESSPAVRMTFVKDSSPPMHARSTSEVFLRTLCCFGLGLALPPLGAAPPAEPGSRNTLTIAGAEIRLNGEPIKIMGLRTSAALVSDGTTRELIDHLGQFRSYGVNTISVYLMGSRFTDAKGYRPDATLDPAYGARLGRIIDAADAHKIIVLVGCLYWGNSRAKEDLAHWTQADADRALVNTVAWLRERGYRNVFVDPDNEGMANAAMKWSIGEMIAAGHAADPLCIIAYNARPAPPGNADLAIHFSPRIPGKPYVETEGSPPNSNYWGDYSKQKGVYNYSNVGVYTAEMKERQIAAATRLIDGANGYILASTWLQAAPPLGPNMDPGGDGTPGNPGIKWWLEYLRDRHGP